MSKKIFIFLIFLIVFGFLFFSFGRETEAAPGWSFVGHRGSAGGSVAGTTISVFPSVSIPQNAILIVRTVSDNPSTVIGMTDYHSVSDSKGNTYTKLREITMASGSPGSGLTVALFASKLSTGLSTTDTVTLTISSSVGAKAIGLEEFSVGTGMTFQLDAVIFSNGNSTTPSVTLLGLTNVTRLWLGLVGIEGPNEDTFTQDTDYANNTSFGTTGGVADTNVASRFGSRVATITSDTYNPTLGTTRDWVDILAALKEVPYLITLSGNAYENEGTSALVACDTSSATYELQLKIGGDANLYNASCDDATGSFTISGIPQPSAGAPMVIFINNVSGNYGSTVNRYSGGGNVTGIAVRRNRVVIRHDDAGPVTNTDMNIWDNDNDTDINYFVSAATTSCDSASLPAGGLCVEAGSKIVIESGKTFAPGGKVIVDAMRVAGTYSGGSEGLTLNGIGTGTTCTDPAGTVRPLCIDDGTFNAPTNTTFAGAGSVAVQAATYNNLNFWLSPPDNITYAYTTTGPIFVNGTTFEVRNFAGGSNSFLNFNLGGDLSATNGAGTTFIRRALGVVGTAVLNTNNYKLTLSGNLTIGAGGILNGGASTITVGGNWSNTGTFNYGTSTVIFNDDTKISTISGSTTFYNLKVETPSKQINFTAGTTQTVQGTLTFNSGHCSTMITLRSTITGDPTKRWNLNVTGSADIKYVNLGDGSATNPLTANNSKDGGNNDFTKWTINQGACVGVNISGKVYSGEGTGALSGKSIALRVDNGVYSPPNATTNSSGFYLFSQVTDISDGSTITVWIDNDATYKGTTVTVTTPTAISDLDIYAYASTVIVRTDGTMTEIKNSGLSKCDKDGPCSDSDIGFTSNGGVLVVDSDRELHIWTGRIFSPGGTISAGGNWDADSGATFIHGNNTVTFTATTPGKTIETNNQSFYNLIFNGSGGGWTIQDAVTVANNLTMTDGTLKGSKNITVSGGNITGTNGSISLTGGTTILSGTGNLGPTGTGTYTFYNLTLAGSVATTTLVNNLTVGNDLSVGVDRTLALNNKNLTVQGGDILTTTTGSITCSGCAAGTVDLSGGGTVGGGTGTITFYNFTLSGSATTTTLGTSIAILNNLSIGANRTLDVSTSNYEIIIRGNWSNSGTFNPRQGTVTFNATTSGKTISPGTSLPNFYNLNFNGSGGGWSFSAPTTIANDFTITNGSVTAPAGNLTVGGNWTKLGTFNHNNGTVIFADSSRTSTLTSNTGFFNLEITTPYKNLFFEAGKTQTISGTLTINGQNCDGIIFLRSTIDDSQWSLNIPNPITVNYVDVKDSKVCLNSGCSGSPPNTITANDSENSGNNQGWDIPSSTCLFAYLSGWAWSENIGWISFNCENLPEPRCSKKYNVRFNTDTGNLSGFAWSENIGWIRFHPPLFAIPETWPGSPNHWAQINFGNNQISGWIRACAGTVNGNCASPSRTDGWDGWIKMRGTTTGGESYGVELDTANNEFRGWAWSPSVVGWISFNHKDCDPNGDGNPSDGPAQCMEPGRDYSINPVPDYKVTYSRANHLPTVSNLQRALDYCNVFAGTGRVDFTWKYEDSDLDPEVKYQLIVKKAATTVIDCTVNRDVPSGEEDSAMVGIGLPPLPQIGCGNVEYGGDYTWEINVYDGIAWSGPVSGEPFSTDSHAHPWVDFDWSPKRIDVGTEVTFDAQPGTLTIFYDSANPNSCFSEPHNPPNTNCQYSWGFPIDAEVTDPVPDDKNWDKKVIFYSTGMKNVTLAVTDSEGFSCPKEHDIGINLPPPEWKEIPPF